MTVKRILKLFLVVSALVTSFSLFAQDRDYEPLTTWPYLYGNFVPGSITTFHGSDIDYGLVNVNVINGKVHYVQDGKIMEADMRTVSSVRIGDDEYVNISGGLVKLLRECERGAVVCSIRVDTEAMNKSDIGYGKSSLASTQNVSLNTLADVNATLNKSLDLVYGEKESGDLLILRKTNGIVYQGMFVPAVRTEILNIYGIDKDAVKKFVKDNKIKFSRVEDLARLVDYLYSLK